MGFAVIAPGSERKQTEIRAQRFELPVYGCSDRTIERSVPGWGILYERSEEKHTTY